LIAVNFSDDPLQARLQVPWAENRTQYILMDALSSVTYERDGDEMRSPGLYVALGPWEYHIFRCVGTLRE